jgi:hypothetical protein
MIFYYIQYYKMNKPLRFIGEYTMNVKNIWIVYFLFFTFYYIHGYIECRYEHFDKKVCIISYTMNTYDRIQIEKIKCNNTCVVARYKNDNEYIIKLRI